MDLSQYLQTYGRKGILELAKRADVGGDYLYKLGKGYEGRKPGKHLARELERVTNGELTYEAMRA